MDFMLNSFKFIDLFCTKFADVFSPLWTMFKGIFCKSGKQFELNGFHQKQNAVAHWFFTRNIFSVYFFRIEESLVSPAQRDQNEMQLNDWASNSQLPRRSHDPKTKLNVWLSTYWRFWPKSECRLYRRRCVRFAMNSFCTADPYFSDSTNL